MKSASRTTATAVVLATAGTLFTATAAPASAAVSCTSPVFKRQFYANTSFSGTPKKTDCDAAIDQNWKTGAPASGLPKDNFGVRWSLTRDFGSGGPFALNATGLDGMRVYVDGVRRIDLWKNVSSTVKKTANVTVPSGKHTLRIDYANWTGAAKVKVTYAPRTTADVDKVKPLAPTGTSVTYDRATGKAKLTWAKNKEMDLAGYRVYRRLKGSSFPGTPLTTTTGTSYTDGTLPVTGDAYYYEVRAHDKAGNESGGSADQLVTTVDRVAPGVPTVTSATGEVRPDGAGTGGLKVGWDKVADAAAYRVFRAASENGTYTAIGRTDQLSYLDTSAAEGKVYYYRVSAVDAAGNESAPSAPQRGKIWDNDPPPLVSGLKVTPTEYGFRLDWDKSPATDLQYYTVHRGELAGDEDEQVCYGGVVDYVSPDETSYTYATLPDGDEACFFLDAVDDEGNSANKWSEDRPTAVVATELDMTPSVATPEGSPIYLSVLESAGDDGNWLTWSGLGGEGSPDSVRGFRVYRWNPATSSYEKIADLGSRTSQYFDTGQRRGTTSYYWVTAVLPDGTETLPADGWAVTAPAHGTTVTSTSES
ncbi:PA14 domain-containing protein [Streptomyces griseorubiginosus]|uniref:fibronectin type III domain-containing protein n=1 Tax=Streptomyces griseorubiginosus TaxID=67304 RepID=UPI0033B8A32F